MSLESLVEKFQIALHNHYIEGGTPLYNVTEMRDFTEKHAPGLFKLILCSIAREGNSITKNRQSLQDQRVVALLHIIAYFRYEIMLGYDIVTQPRNIQGQKYTHISSKIFNILNHISCMYIAADKHLLQTACSTLKGMGR